MTVPNARRQRGKFNARAYKGKIIGYSKTAGRNVYRILILLRGVVIELSYIRFNKTQFETVDDILRYLVDPEDPDIGDFGSDTTEARRKFRPNPKDSTFS